MVPGCNSMDTGTHLLIQMQADDRHQAYMSYSPNKRKADQVYRIYILTNFHVGHNCVNCRIKRCMLSLPA